MIDVHCHLNFHAFEKDIDEVIYRAHKKGVEAIINVGTKIDSSQKAVELAQKYEHLYAIVGIHPHHADKTALNQEVGIMNSEEKKGKKSEGVVGEEGVPAARTEWNEGVLTGGKRATGPRARDSGRGQNDEWLKQLERLARMPKVVAIGEIGMDFFSYKSNGIVDPIMQKETFEAQIELAHRVNLPIQIHNRHAGKEVIEILTHHKNILKSQNPGMFHCFAGDMNILKSALQMGFMIGFDGNSTYPGLAPKETVRLSDLIIYTPLDRIVTETDSPFLSPIPFRGSRNEPFHVILVGEFLAACKHVSFDEINTITTTNAKKLFGI